MFSGLLAGLLVPPAGPIEVDLARACFQEAGALCARDGGDLWGIDLDGPIHVVDPASRGCVANRAAGLEPAGPDVWAGTLPASLPVANTAVAWAGVRWTMLLWPLPEDRRARGTLLMHELFHRVQPALGHVVDETDNSHLDAPDGRTWLRLELRALARALEADAASAGAEAVADALLLRDRRWSSSPDAAAAERSLEFNEGLAEYTGLRLGGLDPAGQRARAVAALRAADHTDSFVRSFAYATGPAYGLLLDDVRPGWRQSVSVRTGLDGLLREAPRDARPAEEPPSSADAAQRGAVYGLGDVMAEETSRQCAREAWAAAQVKRFVDGPVLVLPMREPRFSFDPNRVRPLAGHGSVYDGIEVTDRWGTLRAPAGALWTDDFTLRVPAPGTHGAPGAPAPGNGAARHVEGDGWSLVLADGWAIIPGACADDWTIQYEE